MKNFKINQIKCYKIRFRNLIFLCLSIFLLLTGCVSENGLLYFEDGKAKLFSFKFFMDNDVISNKNFNFTYFDLSKTYVSDDYGNVDLNFRADELLKLSSIFFEDGIYLSDYKDRFLDSDFLKRNILEISIPNFNNKVFLPLSIINNCKKLNIVIWLSKEADDEFMRISYGDKGNKSNKFELEFAEFK
ncbi:MAG: hypothetical protein M0P94_05500, partial [Candidatus Absconditabacterales bacterium]|nr:hypothetical protein [Candidatus Absconditabacterales bacterium]